MRTSCRRRIEHREPVTTGGVYDVLPLPNCPAGTEHVGDVGEHVVGNGEQQQVTGTRNSGGLFDRDARKEGLDAGARGG
jgi:hypothetical protein